MSEQAPSKRRLRDRTTHSGSPLASSTSKDARALRSGVALREALLALLERKPFEQITIRDICAEAGVHYATYFRHHATKESLLDAIATDQISNLSELAQAVRGGSDFEAGFRTMCGYVDEHRALWSTLLNGGAGAAMRQEWLNQAKAVAAIEAPVKTWLPRDLGTVCAGTLIAETLAWWVAQPRQAYSVEDVAKILMRQLTSLMEPE